MELGELRIYLFCSNEYRNCCQQSNGIKTQKFSIILEGKQLSIQLLKGRICKNMEVSQKDLYPILSSSVSHEIYKGNNFKKKLDLIYLGLSDTIISLTNIISIFKLKKKNYSEVPPKENILTYTLEQVQLFFRLNTE